MVTALLLMKAVMLSSLTVPFLILRVFSMVMITLSVSVREKVIWV